MAEYTAKPKKAPPLDMAGITKRLSSGQPLTTTQAAQWIEWKQWTEATDNWAGVAGGGLRDILNALCVSVDKLKVQADTSSTAIVELRAEVQALKEAPAARPFP